jgi:hypothetical protein
MAGVKIRQPPDAVGVMAAIAAFVVRRSPPNRALGHHRDRIRMSAFSEWQTTSHSWCRQQVSCWGLLTTVSLERSTKLRPGTRQYLRRTKDLLIADRERKVCFTVGGVCEDNV